MPRDPVELLEPFRHNPAGAGLFCDFDGTLSPIVADPAAAAPVAGAVELLDRLARRFHVVAVLSGRPVDFLAPRLPDSVTVSGLYGLEVRRDGELHIRRGAERWADVVVRATARCEAEAPEGVLVEPKGLSLTLHYRSDPTLGPRVSLLAERVAADSGLVVRDAKMSVELHPPVRTDKGTVIRELAAGLESACYLGDDLGDLAAYRALDVLAAQGLHTVRVAVRGEEAPAALLDAADLVVDDPAAVVALLRTLL